MHYAEHLDICAAVCCVATATKDNVHRVQTICTRPIQLACMRSKDFIGVSQLEKKIKKFILGMWPTHPWEETPLKNLSEENNFEGKKPNEN